MSTMLMFSPGGDTCRNIQLWCRNVDVHARWRHVQINAS